MNKLDDFEQEVLVAYEKGELKSTSPSKVELTKFKAAASTTFLKEKRVKYSSFFFRFDGHIVKPLF